MGILATQHPGPLMTAWLDQALTTEPGSVILRPPTREQTVGIPFDYSVQDMCFYGRSDLNHPSEVVVQA